METSEVSIQSFFLAAAGVALVQFSLVFVFLPETRPSSILHAKVEWRRANIIGSIGFLLRYNKKRAENETSYSIIGLVIVYCLLSMSLIAVTSTWFFFTKAAFGWETKRVYLVLFIIGMSVVLNQAAAGFLVKKFSAIKVLSGALLMEALATFILAVATKDWHLYISVPFLSCTVLGVICIKSLLSAQVDENEQGELFGALSALETVSAISAKYFFPFVLSKLLDDEALESFGFFPGAVYLIPSVMLLLSFLYSVYLQWRHENIIWLISLPFWRKSQDKAEQSRLFDQEMKIIPATQSVEKTVTP